MKKRLLSLLLCLVAVLTLIFVGAEDYSPPAIIPATRT